MASILVLLFLLSLPILLHFLLPKLGNRVKTRRPPGPRGLPLIGNLHQFDSSIPHRYLWQLSQTYGPLMSLRLGSVSTLVVSSAKMAKEVLKTHDRAFCGRPALLGLQKLSYNGLDLAFSQYNSYWREMRKICVLHLFSAKSVQSFRQVREDEVFKLTREISMLSESESSNVVNLSEMVMALTSAVSCRVAFGKSFELELERFERERFHRLFHEAQAVLSCFYVSDLFPVLGWVDRLTGKNARLEKTFKELDVFYQKIIDEHLNSNKAVESDIIDIMLQLKSDKLCSFDVTFDHIKAILMNIILAGTDTIAAAVVWAMTELMKNPAAMKKAQEEVRSLIGKKKMVDEDDIQKLHYLKAVVKETMRLNPPSPLLLPRETVQGCTIDGYEVRPKTMVYINAWAIGRDRESWEKAEEFRPERFIDMKGSDHFELIPFGGGRRGCPGVSVGALTVELALANLLCLFDWSLSTLTVDIDTEVLPGITIHKKTPLCLVATNHYN